ncbi:MAG: nicotinate phosphoribosyltransferase [Deltaproteobacteria bacterium]|nr:nicotinate phosphoribosyltransferase [Deltaproteobacteria bacterium]
MTSLAEESALATDLYELTMAASYFENHMAETPATFSLYVRNYPPGRGYLVAAGLEDVLETITHFHFSEADLSYLEATGTFSNAFLEYLHQLRFTGDIRALPEGELFFPDEPILEITAPIIEAQVLETVIINVVNLQSMIATKAARCVYAAGGRRVVDFSLRRTQGIEAGMKVARSSYMAGFSATSNVLAGRIYGIPTTGTMAHSYVSSFGDEIAAFRAFARSFPDNTVLLIDTYDTVEGAHKAATVGREMAKEGKRLVGVRLDSGNMVELSRQVRRILDDAGLTETRIFASSSFDEYKIADTLGQGARIDAFGVGTKMGVCADAPYLDMVYKLVEYAGRPIMKLSAKKANLPGKKQVFRRTGPRGLFAEDVIGTTDDTIGDAQALLDPVVRSGRLLRPHPALEEIRIRFRRRFSLLDDRFKDLRAAETYPVRISDRLRGLQEKIRAEKAWN